MIIRLLGIITFGFAFHIVCNWIEGNPQHRSIRKYTNNLDRIMYRNISKKSKDPYYKKNGLSRVDLYIYNKIRHRPHVRAFN